MGKRVLSIQSHVVHGYVGNKAAVFPLQLLGFDVDFINSVHFSNHTGYDKWLTGQVLDGDQLKEVLKGLIDNELLDDIGHVLTGYIGSASFLEAVLDVLKTVREYSPNFRFVCDPVLGDEGKFYVPEELVEVYKTKVFPLADVVTPNQFEAEKLTGVKVTGMETLKLACNKLHSMGPSIVFMTSAALEENDELISIVASEKSPDQEAEIWRIDCPKIAGQFTGTGDLTAALLLAHTANGDESIGEALEKVINTMYVVIERTHKASNGTVKSNELKLIQSKRDIENPPTVFKAKRVL